MSAKRHKARNPYAALEAAVAAGDRAATVVAIAALSYHEKDLLVACRCGAGEREECVGDDVKPGIVHFGRRVRRLLNGIR